MSRGCLTACRYRHTEWTALRRQIVDADIDVHASTIRRRVDHCSAIDSAILWKRGDILSSSRVIGTHWGWSWLGREGEGARARTVIGESWREESGEGAESNDREAHGVVYEWLLVSDRSEECLIEVFGG